MKTNLGWENSGGETRFQIRNARNKCDSLGHTASETHEGQTLHTVWCDLCNYVYSYDSGD